MAEKSGNTANALCLLSGETRLARSYLGFVVSQHPAFCDRTRHDGAISRRHCQLGPVGGVLRLEDLACLKGTFVNSISQRTATAARLSGKERL
jgi:FHA domain